MSKLNELENQENLKLTSKENRSAFKGIITNLEQVISSVRKVGSKALVKKDTNVIKDINAVKDLVDNPSVKLTITFQIYHERYECISRMYDCKKNEVETIVQREYDLIAKAYNKAEKILVGTSKQEVIEFPQEEGPSIKRLLVAEAKKNKQHIYILEKLIRDLTLNFSLFGKDLIAVVECYRDNLIIYPKEYLIEALHHRNYKSFPTINEIEERIKSLDGVRSDFLYKINGYSLFKI